MRCDSHVHIVGPTDQYPQVADRAYLAGIATLEDLERSAAGTRVGRFVIVQPSFYGTDNRLLLHGLKALAGRGRGVAVIDPLSTSGDVLAGFAQQGIRGLRLNLYSRLGDDRPLEPMFKSLEVPSLANNCHIEIIAPLELIAENANLITRSRVPVVIDHYGVHSGFTPDRLEGRTLLDLLALPHVWIKLSAPYRVSSDPLSTTPDPVWLSAILRSAPDRCVWGSDWPHTPPHSAQMGSNRLSPYRNLEYSKLFADFMAAVGSEELAERILSVNPVRLYEFS